MKISSVESKERDAIEGSPSVTQAQTQDASKACIHLELRVQKVDSIHPQLAIYLLKLAALSS